MRTLKGDKNEEQIFQTLNKYMEKLKEWVQFLDVKTPEIIIGIPPKLIRRAMTMEQGLYSVKMLRKNSH